MNTGMSNAAESAAGYYSASDYGRAGRKTKAEESKEEVVVTRSEESREAGKKSRVSGRTIGAPELSEKGAKYYEELRKKYSNLDFILVSKDRKEFAKANAAKYGNAHKPVVLIDEEKIERMAEDEKYRSQYEGIIAQGASGLSQLKNRLASMGMSVKSCGIRVNDNGAASFFATMDKSFKAQGKKAQERLAAKKAAKKAEEKKAQKKQQQEKLEKSREEKSGIEEKDNEVTFTADSIDELMEKIEGMDYLFRNDGIMCEQEKQIGRRFDFSR